LQFSDPSAVYAAHVAPRLAEDMGWSVFEEICGQWLQRHAKQRLGPTVRQMARYWSWDGQTEVDLVAELDHGTYLFGECKWRADSVMHLSDLSALQAKVASLPEARCRNMPNYVLFALGASLANCYNLPSIRLNGSISPRGPICSAAVVKVRCAARDHLAELSFQIICFAIRKAALFCRSNPSHTLVCRSSIAILRSVVQSDFLDAVVKSNALKRSEAPQLALAGVANAND
jgi:hypothetical protein